MDEKDFTQPRIPVATYRLQFNRAFGFAAARRLVSYLRELGISDLYASPCLRARPGSPHGYDIIDPTALNPELGGDEEFAALTEELRRQDLGLLLDIVPNHLCIGSSDNPWWTDLLENGPSSPYAGFFDIDWAPVKPELRDKILYPILGDQYGTVLERGELILDFREGAFFLRYFERQLPILPKSYSDILNYRLAELEELLGAENKHFQELLSIDTALKNLPPHTERDPERTAERQREKEIVKRRLQALCQESPDIGAFIGKNVEIFNGTQGVPGSFDLLDALLRSQAYRLSHWRVATEEINYRRFFDINDLAAIRMENPLVFAETHRLIFRLIRAGQVTGLRIDHLDGLYDPLDYLGRLQQSCFLQRGLATLEKSGRIDPDAADETGPSARLLTRYAELEASEPAFRPFYVIGEKILMPGEQLPDAWPVHGTTGYEFGGLANGLFIEAGHARAFDALYAAFIRSRRRFSEIVYEKKKLVMQAAMSGEINTLGYRLNVLSEVNRHTRDFTLISLIKALTEVIAFFPVYRTYTRGWEVAAQACRYVDHAVARAKRSNPATDPSIFDFVRRLLLLRPEAGAGEEQQSEWPDFVMRFQQLTGPVMAKGVEDTACYVYNRLLSLNEVGADPERFGLPLELFHRQNRERARCRPLGLSATSTHDSKRSEDVRARLNVLSEIPGAWRAALSRWRRINRKKKPRVEGQSVPDANEEYLLYQTLVGAWPVEPAPAEVFDAFRQRIGDYLVKAVREAKLNSSWIRPNAAYEEALLRFVELLLEESDNPFLADLRQFQELTSHCGMLNSLSQTLLKLTAPGIPDFYQGSELWDFSLVDPDNRRPVDFDLRRRHLESLRSGETRGLLPLCRELTAAPGDGRVKLFLIRQALKVRRRERELFERGDYLPLEAAGERAEHLCAFARVLGDRAIIAVAPRFFTRLIDHPGELPLGEDVWRSTAIGLPPGAGGCRFRNLFTGEILASRAQAPGARLHLGEVLAAFPVALLEKVGES